MLVFEKVIDNTLRKIVAMEKAWDVRESKTAAPLSSAGIEIMASNTSLSLVMKIATPRTSKWCRS